MLCFCLHLSYKLFTIPQQMPKQITRQDLSQSCSFVVALRIVQVAATTQHVEQLAQSASLQPLAPTHLKVSPQQLLLLLILPCHCCFMLPRP
jgi:hypothetical protein